MAIESEQPGALRATVIDRFSRIATTPDQERKFSVGPESADCTQGALVSARQA
jgi:hypothetical protein